MNILTFDIEDWYNCDFVTSNDDWDKYEVRIYEGVERILQELEKRELRATFFCLGWIAEKHPNVIRSIHAQGHHIGCHSYKHELTYNLDPISYRHNTEKSKKLIEDLIGESINVYRAPGFSITENNMWALEILMELDFQYDCSLFPASHDYGGFDSFGKAEPVIIKFSNGMQIKEFPINNRRVLTKNFVFSGGGFFRFYPYWLIKYWSRRAPYLMTYFHSRDFDPGQPVIRSLPFMRKFKSYVGLSTSFVKFQKLLNDFDFVSVDNADKLVDWGSAKVLKV